MRRSLIVGILIALAVPAAAAAWILLSDGRIDAQDATAQPVTDPAEPSAYNSLEVHLAVAQEVPGFGGYFEDPGTGKLKVYLKDPANEIDAVVASLSRWLVGQSYVSDGKELQIEVLEGEYNFADLEEWKWNATGSVFSIPEVEYTDAQEMLNRVEIGVTSYDAIPAVKEQLSKAGVPLESVVFELTEPATLDLDDYHSPRVAGLQIQNGVGGGTCTLGFAAMHGYELGFVTASHCSPNRGQVDGTNFYQPSAYNFIGVEEVDPPLMAGALGSICPRYFFCRFSDALWADYAGAVSVDYGYIARPPALSNDWDGSDRFRIIGYQSPNVCGLVSMVGKATGLTFGFVTNTWIDVHAHEYPILMLWQHRASYQRTGGDSGAPVFNYGGGDVLLHGLHWKGGSDSGTVCGGYSVNSYGVFSEISFVLNELNLDTNVSYTGGP